METENLYDSDGGSDYEIKLYINAVSKIYQELKDFCTRFENTKISFLQKCGYNVHAFDVGSMPDPSVFDMVVPGKRNQELLDRYIAKKEMIFVLEWAVNQISSDYRTIATMLFLHHCKGCEVAKTTGMSAAAVSRQKQEIIAKMIIIVRSYFIWKYRDVANAIWDYLHFSVPEKGPLTTVNEWMPDFMHQLASGINKSKKYVEKAVSGVADAMQLTVDSGITANLDGISDAMLNGGTGTTVINNYNNDNSRTVNQTNNSPKSLSRLEIYRQTRNALNV